MSDETGGPGARDVYFAAAPPGLSELGAIVRKSDPDRFEAALFAPPEIRERLFALYAFNLEIARAPWRTQEPQIALMRLQFWRDAVESAVAGESPRAHEVAEPLHRLIVEGAVDPADLLAMIEARETETEAEPPADKSALGAYLGRTAGALLCAAVAVCAERPLASEEAALAGRIGAAAGLARLLEATPLLAAQGRAPLPFDAVDRAALLGGETTDGARARVADLARDAAATLDASRRRRAGLPRAARPALLAIWRAPRILRAAMRPDLDIFSDFGPESPFRRRIGLLYRSAFGRW